MNEATMHNADAPTAPSGSSGAGAAWRKTSGRPCVTRGLDKIFDPRLRREIGELIEDVRAHGDDGVARALEDVRRL